MTCARLTEPCHASVTLSVVIAMLSGNLNVSHHLQNSSAGQQSNAVALRWCSEWFQWILKSLHPLLLGGKQKESGRDCVRVNMIKSVGLFTLYCVLYCESNMKSCG